MHSRFVFGTTDYNDVIIFTLIHSTVHTVRLRCRYWVVYYHIRLCGQADSLSMWNVAWTHATSMNPSHFRHRWGKKNNSIISVLG